MIVLFCDFDPGVVDEVAFEVVDAVLGKFLFSNANAASFFLCFSISSDVKGFTSGFVLRSIKHGRISILDDAFYA